MSITERTRGEEILIRLNEIGCAGAHYKTITEYVRDGVVLPGAIVNPPVSLNQVGGPALSDILGELTAATLLQFEVAVEEINDLRGKLDAALVELTALKEAQAALVEPAVSDPPLAE